MPPTKLPPAQDFDEPYDVVFLESGAYADRIPDDLVRILPALKIQISDGTTAYDLVLDGAREARSAFFATLDADSVPDPSWLRHLVAVDTAGHRLRLALDLGATVALDPADCDVPEEIRRITAGRGADAVIEFAGNAAAATLAARLVRPRGRLVVAGVAMARPRPASRRARAGPRWLGRWLALDPAPASGRPG